MSAAEEAPLILCVGIAVRDLVFRVRQLPALGTKAGAQSFREYAGGNAVNAAIAIARLGARAEFCGPLGEDAGPLIANLHDEGIITDHVVGVAGVTTPVSGIFIDENGERTIATYRLRNLTAPPPSDLDALIAPCAALCVDNRFPYFAAPICAAARRAGLPVVIDVDHGKEGTADLIRHGSHVVFSLQGLLDFSQCEDIESGLTMAASAAPELVGVTCGADGVVWRAAHGALERLPGFQVQAIDTLGAGDVFHGALALALAEGQGTHAAMRFASAAAALKCTHQGGAFGTPPRVEVEALLARP